MNEDLTIQQGSRWFRFVSVKEPNGDPTDLTGYEVKTVVGNTPGTLVGEIANPKNGLLKISVPSDHSFLPGVYDYEVDIESETNRDTVLIGKLTVRHSLFVATEDGQTDTGTLTGAVTGPVAVDEGGTVSLAGILGGDAQGAEGFTWSAPLGTFDNTDTARVSWTAPTGLNLNRVVTITFVGRKGLRTVVVTHDIAVTALTLSNAINPVEDVPEGGSAVLSSVVTGTANVNITEQWTTRFGSLVNPTSSTPTFNAPDNIASDLVNRVTHVVTGKNGKTSRDEESFTIKANTFSIAIKNISALISGGTTTVSSTLGGTSTGDTTYTYVASIGTFDDPNSAAPEYTAPAVQAETEVTITVTAMRQGKTATDTETFTIGPKTLSVTTSSVPATVREGDSAITVRATAVGTAQGVGSYSWAKTGPGTLANQNTATLQYTPPDSVDSDQTVSLTATVQKDGLTAVSTKTFVVKNLTLNGTIGAIDDQYEGDSAETLSVTLGGTHFKTPGYVGTLLNNRGSLTDANTASPKYTPPASVAANQTETFQCVATRGDESITLTRQFNIIHKTLTAAFNSVSDIAPGADAFSISLLLGGTARGDATYVFTEPNIGTLSSTTVASPTYTPPATGTGDVTISCTVTRDGITATASLTFSILPPLSVTLAVPSVIREIMDHTLAATAKGTATGATTYGFQVVSSTTVVHWYGYFYGQDDYDALLSGGQFVLSSTTPYATTRHTSPASSVVWRAPFFQAGSVNPNDQRFAGGIPFTFSCLATRGSHTRTATISRRLYKEMLLQSSNRSFSAATNANRTEYILSGSTGQYYSAYIYARTFVPRIMSPTIPLSLSAEGITEHQTKAENERDLVFGTPVVSANNVRQTITANTRSAAANAEYKFLRYTLSGISPQTGYPSSVSEYFSVVVVKSQTSFSSGRNHAGCALQLSNHAGIAHSASSQNIILLVIRSDNGVNSYPGAQITFTHGTKLRDVGNGILWQAPTVTQNTNVTISGSIRFNDADLTCSMPVLVVP